MQELLDKCHPLGMFDSISTLAVASNMRELYRLVLVDTPLAPYFAESLTSGQHRVARGVGLPGHPLGVWSLAPPSLAALHMSVGFSAGVVLWCCSTEFSHCWLKKHATAPWGDQSSHVLRVTLLRFLQVSSTYQ